MEKQQKQKDTVEKKQQKPTETEKSVPLAVASSPPNSQTPTVAPVQSTAAPTQTQVEEKKQEPAKASKPQVKKDEAVARGLNLPISKKHSMYICSFIKNKSVESAIADLEQVLKFKQGSSRFKGDAFIKWKRKNLSRLRKKNLVSRSTLSVSLVRGVSALSQ